MQVKDPADNLLANWQVKMNDSLVQFDMQLTDEPPMSLRVFVRYDNGHDSSLSSVSWIRCEMCTYGSTPNVLFLLRFRGGGNALGVFYRGSAGN